jgi:hypothetical protein
MGEYNEEFEEPDSAEQMDNYNEYENNSGDMEERESDYPVELIDSQNQYLESQESQGRTKMQNRPVKNKKNKKSKMNNSITNRSSSSKWKKMDPYIQGQPTSQQIMKQMKRSQQADENSAGILPPIRKQSNSLAQVSSSRSYKPLQTSKVHKANNTTLKDMNSNVHIEDNRSKSKIVKNSDIDYEQK